MGTWNPLETHAQKAHSVTTHGTYDASTMARGYARNTNTHTQYQSGIRRISLRMPPHRAHDSRRSEVPALRSLQCGYGMDLCAFCETVPPEALICLGLNALPGVQKTLP